MTNSDEIVRFVIREAARDVAARFEGEVNRRRVSAVVRRALQRKHRLAMLTGYSPKDWSEAIRAQVEPRRGVDG